MLHPTTLTDALSALKPTPEIKKVYQPDFELKYTVKVSCYHCIRTK